MRRVCLAAALLVAAVTVPLHGQEPKAPGCVVKAYHAYSECNAKDGLWHVVTDAICADGSRTRVHDIATDQPCKGDKAVKKAPQPQTALKVGLAGCDHPKPDGEIYIQQCIDSLWYNVKYLRYICDAGVQIDAAQYFATGKPCGDGQEAPKLDPANPGTAAAAPISMAPLDFGDPVAWSGPQKPVTRDANTQLMMIDLLDFNLPGTRVARADPLVPPAHVVAILADAWHALAHAATPSLARGFSSVNGAELWMEPGTSTILQGVTRSTRVHAYLTSLGTSTGEAFDVTIVNDTTAPVRLAGDGVVVEPIKKGTDKDERSGLQKAMATRGAAVATSKANAYCLEFKLNPPEQGSMFHVVDAAMQQKYSAARDILHASRQLQATNQLQPDSNPTDYYHAIRQWAIWVDEQHFTTRAQYAQAFVERTKKNVAAVKQQWTKQMEDTLNQLAPHRWDEIVKILRAAGHPVPGA
jgi:hypothetical protein